MTDRKRGFIVVVYALAMAWVESAVVLYLRTMFDRIEPHQANPMPMVNNIAPVELAREAATMIMLLTVGALAGDTWRKRLGYTAIAFGVWDIFYYVFLKMMCGWPHSVMDWDVLFLIPLPWWGPVLSPVLIAMLMVFWGTVVTQCERSAPPLKPDLVAWAVGTAGAFMALRVFMADAIAAAPHGAEAVRNVLPKSFNWPEFIIALLLMGAPLAQSLWHVRGGRLKISGASAPLAGNLEYR